MKPFDAFVADEEVAAIGRGLVDRTLPKPRWTHAAHFAAALWLLRERPRVDVDVALPEYIKRYNVATGVPNTDVGGYHETITRASLRAARAFAGAHVALPLFEAVNLLMTASPFGDPKWPLAYWSHARLFSVEARRAWCEPDLGELPF